MAKRAEAYVDTSALIALVDRSDSYHFLFRRRFSEPPPLITTTLVVTEGHGWFLRRYDRSRALYFLAMLEEMPFLEVTAVGPRDIESAAALMRRFSDQDLTLVDATGLQLMQTLGLRTCWSTDHHLSLLGATLTIHCP